WKYVDACGNVSDEFVQTKTWTVDVTKPSVSGQATITGTICNVVPAFVDPIATEGCSTASLVTGYPIDGVVTDAPNCKKTQTRTWKYVDACGNVSDEFVQTKTWTVDNTPPTITPSANVTIDCTATPSFTLPTVSDACSAATVSQVGSDVTVGNSCVRTITRTWNAVDACGNTSGTVAQTITLADMTPPTMGSAGGNTTINCTASPNFTAPTASDDCSGATVNLLTNTTTGNSCTRIYTRTWDAVDACGNHSATRTQVITVIDNTPPTIGTPGANGTVICPATPSFTPPTASDVCSTASVQQVSDVTTQGTCAGTYTETITWRAVDGCGNLSVTVSQTITVIDNTPPTIGPPGANGTVICPATPSFTPPTASDVCSTASVQQVSDVTTHGTCEATYKETLSWRAVDGCCNLSGTVSQKITVIDNTPPTIVTPGANGTVICPATPSFTAPTASDACSTASVQQVSDVT